MTQPNRNRRAFLAGAGALGLAAPFALAAGRSLALTRAPALDFDALPICRAAADGEPVPPSERKPLGDGARLQRRRAEAAGRYTLPPLQPCRALLRKVVDQVTHRPAPCR